MSRKTEIKPLKVDMPRDMQDFILYQAERQLRKFEENPKMELNLEPTVQNLADALKKQYQGVWQVVIINGTYSAFSAYVQQRLFHMKYGRFVILVWQSSSY
uniref:Dynein light chain type 1 n=1 Tax=Schistocephalus solidus TaxID=70667 RepID=A0A0X3P706_SCHSO